MYFRAFFGVPDSLRPDGTPVNAVRGLLDFVATWSSQYRPTDLVCCWDDDWRPQWRVDLIPSYKAHRVVEPSPATPDIEEVPDLLEVAGPDHPRGARRVRHPGRRAPRLRGGRHHRHARHRRRPAGRRRHRRPRPVPARRRRARRAGPLHRPRRRQPRRSSTTLDPRSTASTPASTSTSPTCAATPPTGCRASGHRREDRRRAARAYGDLDGILAAAHDRGQRPRHPARARSPRLRATTSPSRRRWSRRPRLDAAATGIDAALPLTPRDPERASPRSGSSWGLGGPVTRLIGRAGPRGSTTRGVSRRRTCRPRHRGAALDAARGRVAQPPVAGGVGDLAGQVEQLLHPAHEVAGGQVGLAAARRRGRRPRPSARRPRRSRSRARAGSPAGARARAARGRPTSRHRLGDRLARPARWAAAAAGVVGRAPRRPAPRARPRARPAPGRPTRPAQALGGEQVEVGVDPHAAAARVAVTSSPSR